MEGSLEAVTKGMSGQRREVFERVWRRVMHSGASEDMPLEEAGSSQAPGGEPAPVPALAPADIPQGDYPGAPGVLGEDCREYLGLIQAFIREALEGWRTYQALAKRAGGGPGRTLAALGAGEKRRARELNAVGFLISGTRFWPDPEKTSASGSYLGTLRRLFRREQAAMAAYLAGAETVTDPCLRELFLRHAGEAWDRSCRIRALVEQM